VFLHLSSRTYNQRETKREPKQNLKEEKTHVQTIFHKNMNEIECINMGRGRLG